MKRIAALIAAFASLSCQAAGPLSWADCVALAQKNNADLLAAVADAKSAEAKLSAARGAWLPHIEADLNYDKSNRTVATNTGLTTGGYTAQIQASENLFSGFADRSRIEQARAAYESAQAALDAARAKVSYDLKNAFEGFVNAHEAVTLTTEILKRREENYRLVDLRFQSGLENKGSVLLSQAYLGQAKYENMQAQNNDRLARVALLEAVGLDTHEDVSLTGFVPISDPGVEPGNFDELVEATPDQRKARSDEESARWAVTSARAGFLPTLGLSGSVGRSGADFFPDDRRNWSWGIGLTIPLFDGGQDFYATRAAAASLEASSSRKVSTRRALREKLQTSYLNFNEAVSKLKVDESFQLAALTRADIARHKYNNGLLTFEDWDVIENDLIQRQKTVLSSRKDRVLAEADWEQSRGVGAIK